MMDEGGGRRREDQSIIKTDKMSNEEESAGN